MPRILQLAAVAKTFAAAEPPLPASLLRPIIASSSILYPVAWTRRTTAYLSAVGSHLHVSGP